MNNKQQSWSQYWQQGSHNSCIGAEQDQQVVDVIWKEWLSEVPQKSVLVDLATGNGAVLKSLIKGESSAHRLRYFGVDYSLINPDDKQLRGKENIKFLPLVDIATLPFSSDSIDGITSQFGFEYADEIASLAEISRVLTPNGKLQLIIHHLSGEIVKANQRRLDEISLLLESDSPLTGAINYIEGKQSANLLEQAGQLYLTQHQAVLSKGISGLVFSSICQAVIVYEQHKDSNKALELLNKLSSKLSGERNRLQQLVTVAKSEAGINRLIKHLKNVGISGEYRLLKTNDELTFAWLVKGRKHG